VIKNNLSSARIYGAMDVSSTILERKFLMFSTVLPLLAVITAPNLVHYVMKKFRIYIEIKTSYSITPLF
jgi:hypothetical protein